MSWTSVSKLSVVLATGQQRGQLPSTDDGMGVVVSLQPTDNNGDPITVKKLLEDVVLIDYVDESPLEPTQKDWYCESVEALKGRIPQIKYTVKRQSSSSALKIKTIGA